MRLLAPVCALVLAAGAVAPAHAQRDTLRIGAPRDTARVPAPAPVPTDTLTPLEAGSIFDTPQTRALVTRVMQSGSTIPAGLEDYRATMGATIYLSLQADTAQGGELPVTVDEFAGEVRWDRAGDVQQTVQGHRVRMLAPAPYTIGSLVAAPWVVPHLYGNTITAFSLSATPNARARILRAVHPFSFRGVDFYEYRAGGPVRVSTAEGVVTLVPITVRPRAGKLEEAAAVDTRLVAGTFWTDVDRAAIARARFGFVERGGRFVVTETGMFFELEGALVGGRYWLPHRQRREMQVASPLLGGAVAVRAVTTLSGFELNTGWAPPQPGVRLVWQLEDADDAFARLPPAGDQPAPDIGDFADLVAVVRPPERTGGVRASLRYDRGEHLFRFNRVEGAFVGVGIRVEPANPEQRDWDVYTHLGWAFAEATPRGELAFRWHPGAPNAAGPRWGATVGAYRRLRDMTSFRPPLQWELGYAAGAALGGYDVRDYYDAAGAEAFAVRRGGSWTARIGGRFEGHDSVTRNTTTYLFGTAQDFPDVAPAEPGTHAAVEGTLRYARGTGAFGVGGGVIGQLSAEQGFGDFGVTRATALLSTRFPSRYVTVIARGDAGTVIGGAPPQFLYRFGGIEGLRGYGRNEFGGSTAVLGRARLLLHLPPYGQEPLFRAGLFLFPPLRPALALSGDAGWASVSGDSRASLQRLGAAETDGVRSSYGVGLSLFEDAVSVEYVWPGDGGQGRWYTGFVAYF
ncbi:MAG TPA: hypothetical protein VGC13_05560 [Longimicrobium sp.]|jgi:hypothetical protein|uniref:hypothetical protein n=1 Tax=Longimicrobium sp. TaxID=2029185 RepID=UPI002EDB2452